MRDCNIEVFSCEQEAQNPCMVDGIADACDPDKDKYPSSDRKKYIQCGEEGECSYQNCKRRQYFDYSLQDCRSYVLIFNI